MKYLNQVWLLTLLFMLSTVSLQGKDIKVDAYLDKSSGTLEDYFNFTLDIMGSQSSPQVDLDKITDFKIISQSHSSKINIYNMRQQITSSFLFILEPQKEGVLKIPALRVVVEGQQFRTKELTVKIAKVSSTADPKQAKEIFLDAKVSTKKPVIGQQIVYTMRLYSRVQFSNAQLEEPEFTHFQKEDIPENKEYYKMVKGHRYKVIEVNRILIPQQAGKVEIPAAEIHTYILKKDNRRRRHRSPFDDFFSMGGFATRKKKVRLRSPKIKLNVRNLPTKGKPPNFLNIVGRVSLNAKYDQNNINVGDSVTITIDAVADTDLEGVTLNKLTDDKSYKIYEDKPTYINQVRDNKIYSQKTFKFAIVPLKAGLLTIPPFTLPYYDTKTQAYRTAETTPLTFQVNQGEAVEPTITTSNTYALQQKKQFKMLGDDILPIYERPDALKNQRLTLTSFILLMLPASLLALCYLTLSFYQRRLRFLQSNKQIITGQKAFKKAFRSLKDLEKESSSEELLKKSCDVIRLYLGEKTHLNLSAYTGLEIKQFLESKEVSAPLPEETSKFFSHLDNYLYGQSKNSSIESNTLLSETKELLSQLEKEKNLKPAGEGKNK